MFGKKTGKPQSQIDSLIGVDTRIDGISISVEVCGWMATSRETYRKRG